jgi:2-amino-4-hydroxy-6-hydroxymethyldihydropteridine diphosphokinase
VEKSKPVSDPSASHQQHARMSALETWQPAYVGIGSNQQDPPAQVREAMARLANIARTRLVATSSLYGSKPLTQSGNAAPAAQPDFVNAAAGLLTQLTPETLLGELKAIERAMGRAEVHEKWGPRVIDLDLLVLGVERRTGEKVAAGAGTAFSLTLPHPGISDRNFVLYPLAEIAPDLDVPGLGRVAKLRERVGADGLWRLHEPPTRTSA